jgi:hypothetical protein
VRRLSAMRFRECRKIEAGRSPLMEGMVMLIHAHAHLKQEPSTPENALALEQILSIIGRMEEKNKTLADKSSELWRAVLALDGPELSNPEIARERERIEQGIKWLDRIRKRLALDLIALESREESLMTLSELDGQLYRLRYELGATQESYQMAQAEALTRRFGTDEN